MVLKNWHGLLHARTYALILAVALLPASALSKTDAYVLKFATLAPVGSTWMNLMQEWADDVATQSNGRLKFKFYPGGVQGDEPDVLRKIRFKQLDGGAFTGYGIGNIHAPSRVLELPFLFQNYAEIDHVRAQFMPDIEQGFRDGGFELLGWMEVGFVHFFSQKPINTLDDLKGLKIWLWQGDPLGQAMFTAGDLSPIPLSITDVFTSLSTGLIDTVYCTPLAAIALQWFTKTKYITSTPMTNAIGALVVSNRFYQKLPADLREILKKSGEIAGEKLIEATRRDNRDSMDILKAKGMQLVFDANDVDPKELFELRDKAAESLAQDNYIPAEMFARTRALLEEFRDSAAAADTVRDDP